jgi:hypothetical protein
VIQLLVILAVLIALVLFLTAPLRRASAEVPAAQQLAESEVAELEAAREAKYRELRDAELDHSTGKLSDEDYELLDASLRTEAVEILKKLDTATISER